jgi:DNA replication protein DnaC
MERMAQRPITRKPQDYDKDGVLFCGDCNEPKQKWLDWFPDADGVPQKRLVPVLCRCETEKIAQEEEKDRKRKFDLELRQLREEFCLQPPNVESQTFAVDDSPSSDISDTCRRYVADFDNMAKNNIGIIFYGPKGRGKSFYAACIVNELAKRQVRTCFTTTARLMSILQGRWDKSAVIDNLNNFRLLVLDDLGAERNTEFGAEIMYNVIDNRYRKRLPLIVTTNLDLADIKSETDLLRNRIYDRVVEMCPIPLKMLGESRRTAAHDERKEMARDFLKKVGRQADWA